MSYQKLLLQNDTKEPKIRFREDRINITLKHAKKVFDADLLEEIRKEINYIYENELQLISTKKSIVRILVNIDYFKDRTILMLFELLIYCLCLKGDFNLYVNLKISDTKSITYIFYCFSILKDINGIEVSNVQFCDKYENYFGNPYATKNAFGMSIRKIIDMNTYKDKLKLMHIQQTLSTDIMNIFGFVINNEHDLKNDIIDDACEIVDELVDNILSHTVGVGIVDVATVNSLTQNDIYIMINVVNISNNKLYTNIKDTYKRNIDDFKERSKIKDYFEYPQTTG